MGRHTRGVRGILLKDNDYLVSMGIVPEITKSQQHLLIVTENGVGKRSNVYLYPLQKRGGIGVKVAALTDKTGKIAGAQVVTENHDQIILVSKKAVTIKLPIKNVPLLSRNTKGVILMRFKTGDDKVSALTVLEKMLETEVKNIG